MTVFKHAKKVAGRTRKVHSTTDSDWKTYTGSCAPLQADIEKLGIENFSFEILAWGKTKGSTRYMECWTLWEFEALSGDKDANGERLWYNAAIDGVKFMRPKDVTTEQLNKIRHYLS